MVNDLKLAKFQQFRYFETNCILKKMCSQNIASYKVLPLPLSSSTTSCHNLFLKEHTLRHVENSKPPGKTLFIINVPPYVTEDNLKESFSIAGLVESVIFHCDNETESNDGFRRAYLVFDKRESLLKALKLESLNPLSSEELPLKVGLEYWIMEYNSTMNDPNELQQRINTFMDNYEKAEERKNVKTKEIDDEGWTVVSKRGRHPGIARKESIENKLKEKNIRGPNKKELKNFYTFQIRDSKMKNIAALRKNFEEAKNKVQLMKSARKFRPF